MLSQLGTLVLLARGVEQERGRGRGWGGGVAASCRSTHRLFIESIRCEPGDMEGPTQPAIKVQPCPLNLLLTPAHPSNLSLLPGSSSLPFLHSALLPLAHSLELLSSSLQGWYESDASGLRALLWPRFAISGGSNAVPLDAQHQLAVGHLMAWGERRGQSKKVKEVGTDGGRHTRR